MSSIIKLFLCEITAPSMSGWTGTNSDLRLFHNGNEIARFKNPGTNKWSTSNTDVWMADRLNLDYQNIISSGELSIGLTSNDEYKPDAFMIWAIIQEKEKKFIVPISEYWRQKKIISQDISEGVDRLKIPNLKAMMDNDEINRLALFFETTYHGDTLEPNRGGTNATLVFSLYAKSGDVPVLAFQAALPEFGLSSHKAGQANSTFFCFLEIPKFKNVSLKPIDIEACVIRNDTRDSWTPFRGLIFALDSRMTENTRSSKLIAHSAGMNYVGTDYSDISNSSSYQFQLKDIHQQLIEPIFGLPSTL